MENEVENTVGDMQDDDLSRFIPDEVSGLSDGIAVYDQNNQRVHWFVTNSDGNGRVLTLDKNTLVERPGISPWTRYITQHESDFVTNAASYIRDPGANTYDVYWGDSSGRLFKLNGTTGGGDAGSINILTRRKTKQIITDARFTDIIGRVEYRRKAAVTLTLDFDWAVHAYIERSTVDLLGPVITADAIFFGESIYFGEEIYWGQGSVSQDILSNRGFSPAGKGETFFIELSVDSTGNFLINRIIL